MIEYFTIFTFTTGWLYLLLLTGLEIVLGIDNIIFISIVTDKLGDLKQRSKARNLGLSLSLIIRFIMLGMLSFLARLNDKIYGLISWHDLVLLLGGIFLIYKSTVEMHRSVVGKGKKDVRNKSTFSSIVAQIVLIDIVFSFDSVISAVGMTSGIGDQIGKSNPIAIIYLSVLISMIVMLIFSQVLSEFISKNPTIKMIALSFLLMIGILLIAESYSSAFEHKGTIIPKGYIYFGFAFSMFVEILNIRMRRNNTNSGT